jgi:hypothetical protein
MFDMSFTGEVVEDEGVLQHLAIITLGEVTDGIAASFSFWSEVEYHRQWLEGARRLLEPNSHSAFITDMADPATAFVIQWWPAWRLNDLIVFQRQLLFIGAKEGDETYNPRAARFCLEDPYRAVRDRDEGHSEDCRQTGVCRRPKIGSRFDDHAGVDLCVSEWWVYLEEMREFVERRTKDWAM